jgi:hypothetical protein
MTIMERTNLNGKNKGQYYKQQNNDRSTGNEKKRPKN